MEFNKDDFIYHTSYRTGRVTSVILPTGVETDLADVSIDFKTGEIKTFSKYLLERSCHKISPLGFHAFAYLDPAGAALAIQEKPVEVILMVLQDFPGLQATTDDIKYYLASLYS